MFVLEVMPVETKPLVTLIPGVLSSNAARADDVAGVVETDTESCDDDTDEDSPAAFSDPLVTETTPSNKQNFQRNFTI